jgi:hypothetical protein
METNDSVLVAQDQEATVDNEAAYNAVLASALALPEAELPRITTDVIVAAGAVEPRLPAIAELRAEAADALPRHDFTTYDALEQRAKALRYSEALYRTAVAPPPPTSPLVEELQPELGILVAEDRLLSARGHIPSINQEAVQLGNNHRQLALNVINMVVHFRTHWPSIEGKTTMTPAGLKALEHKAERLDRLVSLRDSQPARIAEASRIRLRMFAMFMLSVKEVERAAFYLHEADIDKYVPQVFVNRGRPRGEAKEKEKEKETAVGTGDSASATPAPAQTTPPPAMNGAVGSPNSSPFVRVG